MHPRYRRRRPAPFALDRFSAFVTALSVMGIFPHAVFAGGWTPVFQTPTHEIVRALSSPTDETCWFITNFDRVYKTSNGGATWTTINNGVFIPSALFVVDDQLAFKIGTAAVYRTTNGGVSWVLVFSPGGGMTPEVWMVDSLTGFVSYSGVLRKTTNGGTTWSTTGVTQPPSPIASSTGRGSLWSQGNDLWVALDDAGVAYSPDLGNSWVVPTNDGINFNRAPVISFADLSFGAAIQQGSTDVFVTVDGGNHWSVTDVTFGDNVGVVTLGQHAWYIPNPADHFYLKYSSDSGSTWSQQLTETIGFEELTRSRGGHAIWTGTTFGRIYRYLDEEPASVPMASASSTLMVFPNPCSDRLQLGGWPASDAGGELAYRIVGIDGAIAVKGRTSSGVIDLAGLASGLYLLEGRDTRTGIARVTRFVKR